MTPAPARETYSPLATEIITVARGLLQHRVEQRDDARYTGGPRAYPVTLVVWHCTAGDRAKDGIEWLNRPNAESKASYHYVIDIDGKIIRTCNPSVIAYHAGKSSWEGRQLHGSVNAFSIGVSFANDNGTDGNTRDDPLTLAQLESGLWLARVLSASYRLGAGAHIGHCECAPGRKTDPLPRILDMHDWRAAIALVCQPTS